MGSEMCIRDRLGADSVTAHRSLADELARYRVTHLIAVGNSAEINALLERSGELGISTLQVNAIEEAAAGVKDIVRAAPPGEENWRERTDRDVVLIKASNAVGLWRVAESLLEQDKA